MKRSEIRGGLDTSVLVRLLTGEPAAQSEAAYSYLSETQSRGELLLVSDLVVAETYFACQHHYRLPKDTVLSGLHRLLAEPIFLTRDATLALLSEEGLATAKPGFVDRLIHAEYAKESVSLVTFEKAARKLDNVWFLSDEAGSNE